MSPLPCLPLSLSLSISISILLRARAWPGRFTALSCYTLRQILLLEVCGPGCGTAKKATNNPLSPLRTRNTVQRDKAAPPRNDFVFYFGSPRVLVSLASVFSTSRSTISLPDLALYLGALLCSFPSLTFFLPISVRAYLLSV